MIEGAIFDMDGLMIDSERVWLAQWPKAAEAFGLPFRQELADRTRGTTLDEGARIAEEIYQDMGPIDGHALLSLLQKLAYESFWTEPVPAKPGLFELLNYLGGWHIPCAVASSSELSLIEHQIGNLGLAPAFQTLVSGRDPGIRHSKPEPDIFLEAARRLGCAPEHTLVLEDSYAGVKAGAKGGFITVMVPDLSPATDEMRHLASCICQDLGEVADLLDAGRIG